MSIQRRKIAIAGTVVLLHVGAMWGLQHGLPHRPAASVIPVLLLAEPLEPIPPAAKPPALVQPVATPVKAGMAGATAQGPKTPAAGAAALQPVSAPDPAAAAGTAAVVAAVTPAATLQEGATSTTSAVLPAIGPAGAPTASARVQLPSSDAEYLHNPKPVYPPMSRRLGEQGTVLVNVLIGVDGNAQSAEIRKSSGYDRLDQSALAMVRKWRYTPGTRAGVPEPMWFTVPIPFVLE